MASGCRRAQARAPQSDAGVAPGWLPGSVAAAGGKRDGMTVRG